jgi:hypothetical protein
MRLQLVSRRRRAERRLAVVVTERSGRFAAGIDPSTDSCPCVLVRAYADEGYLVGESEAQRVVAGAGEAELRFVVRPAGPTTELGKLRAALGWLFDGEEPTRLSAEDEDWLLGCFANSALLTSAALSAWSMSARLSTALGIPTTTAYGLARALECDADAGLRAVLERSATELRSAVETAVSEEIVGSSAMDAVAELVALLPQLRVEHGLAEEKRLQGRLRAVPGDRPLSGWRVVGEHRRAAGEPQPLAPATSDADGSFAVAYVGASATDQGMLALRVLAPSGTEVSEAEVDLGEKDSNEPLSIEIPLARTPAAVHLEELARRMPVEVPDGLIEFLADRGIETVDEIRRLGGIGALDGLPVANDHSAVRRLDAYSELAALSGPQSVWDALIDAGYRRPSEIAAQPRSAFVTQLRGRLGAAAVARAHVEAGAQARLLNGVLVGLRAEFANGHPASLAGIANPHEEMLAWFRRTCECPDCRTAVSPGAYLAELARYATEKLRRGGAGWGAVDLAFLEGALYQPFSRLPSGCDGASDEVRQARIAVEVLLRCVEDVDGPREAALVAYRRGAYGELLTRIGTGLSEIRVAARDDGLRDALASRLGVSAARIAELVLESEPSAASSRLNEGALQRIFGLQAFVAADGDLADPLATVEEPDLVRWRRAALREQWESADRAEGADPLVDPDVIHTGHLRNTGDPSEPGFSAYRLWLDRWSELAELRADLQARREARVDPADIATFDDWIAAELAAALAPAAVTMAQLLEAAEDEAAGKNVADRLAAWTLERVALHRIVALRESLSVGADPLESDWDDVYDILVNANKRTRRGRWLEEELAADLHLGPAYFRLPGPPSEIPPPPAPELPRWRATWQERKRWEDTLEGRIGEHESASSTVAEAVAEVEQAILPALRDALVEVGDFAGADAAARAVSAERQLLIDTRNDGCHVTTRLGQAIETFRSLLRATQARELTPEGPLGALRLTDPTFADAWTWLGSYASWRAAMFVLLYTDNYAYPQLLPDPTPGFRQLVADLREDRHLSPDSACRAAGRYAQYLRDVADLRVAATCEAITTRGDGRPCRPLSRPRKSTMLHMFAQGASPAVYWARYDRRLAAGSVALGQSHWVPVRELAELDVRRIVGAVPYEIDETHRYIALFVVHQVGVEERLALTRYDLDRGRWEGELLELETPGEGGPIRATALQSADASEPPTIVFAGEGVRRYVRSLGVDGKSWSDADTQDASGGDGDEWEAYAHRLPIVYGDDLAVLRDAGDPERLYWCLDAPESNIFGWVAVRYRPGETDLEADVGAGGVSGVWISQGSFRGGVVREDGGVSIYSRLGVATRGYRLVGGAGTSFDLSADDVRIAPSFGPSGEGLEPGSRVGRQVALDRSRGPGPGRAHRALLSPAGSVESLGERAPLCPYLAAGADAIGDEVREWAPVRSTYAANAGAPAPVLACLDESFYFVRTLIGMQLQRSGHYEAALRWFRTVYDYTRPEDGSGAEARTAVPLLAPAPQESSYEQPEGWLADPLQPHGIARMRQGTYRRFTLMTIVSCMLDHADAEFSRDLPESRARAREQYTRALRLLDSEDLKQRLGECESIIGTLRIRAREELEVPPALSGSLDDLLELLRPLDDEVLLGDLAEQVEEALRAGGSWEDRFAAARERISKLGQPSGPAPSLAEAVEGLPQRLGTAHRVLLTRPAVSAAAADVSVAAGSDFAAALEAVTGAGWDELSAGTKDTAWLADASGPAMEDGLEAMREFHTYEPPPSFYFCVPPNPMLWALRQRGEINLRKLQTCRNIAGLERPLDPYGAPTDPSSGLPSFDGAGAIVPSSTGALVPTVHRYAALRDRAKELAQRSAEMEAVQLAALQQREVERYQRLQAAQGIETARAGLRLQDLRLREADDGVALTHLQRDRAQIQIDTFGEWIDKGPLETERQALTNQLVAAVLYGGAGVAALMPKGALSVPDGASSLAHFGSSASTVAAMYMTVASFERRDQEWRFQLALAEQDAAIADAHIGLALDHLRIVGQEKRIAEVQLDHAAATVEFLTGKLLNAELWDWMAGTYEGLSAYYRQEATAVARLAQQQLAFERQQPVPGIVGVDYWTPPGDGSLAPAEGEEEDRRGLTGSARLLRDLYRLDQYAFESERRKLQLRKTISLAHLDPFAFAQFRETGVLRFRTPIDLFARDYPSHYLGLIKRASVSVLALVPPVEGVHATLSSVGLSRVVVSRDGRFESVPVRRLPESVALSSPRPESAGLDLHEQPGLQLPFEGSGLDQAWELRMPKAANPLLDFDTIFSVYLTLDFTALSSPDRELEVTRELGRSFAGTRTFSFRHEFADQWYDLHNPDQTDTPMVASVATRRDDFPPNLAELRVRQVALYFVRRDGADFEVPVDLRLTPEDGGAPLGGLARTIEGVASTQRGNAPSWRPMASTAPLGTWRLDLTENLSDGRPVRQALAEDEIEDILLAVTYGATSPAWPE